MRTSWRILLISALLAFAAGQFVHANHILDDSNGAVVEHSVCYICQSHSAAALSSNPGWNPVDPPPFDHHHSAYLSISTEAFDHQRQARAPPHA